MHSPRRSSVLAPVVVACLAASGLAAAMSPADAADGDLPWPGGQAVTTVDEVGLSSDNLSGLYYEGTGNADTGTLWAVQNGPAILFKLKESDGLWTSQRDELVDPDWAGGKQLLYKGGDGNGYGVPDAEGLTFTDRPADGVFVATERNDSGAASKIPRPAILRFDPTGTGEQLVATGDWNLTADILSDWPLGAPPLDPNEGIEAIAWVPDSYLTDTRFMTDAGTVYDPTDYYGDNHGNGLFFVGLEQTGKVYAYALDLKGTSYQRVTSFDSGFSKVMELHFEEQTQQLWAVCDNTCEGRTARLAVDTTEGSPTAGTFVPVAHYLRPTGMDNLNNEGFTTTPASECSGGVKPVFWAEDGDTGDHSLRQGTLRCGPDGPEPVEQVITFTTAAPASPVVGQTYNPAATGGPSGNPVVFSITTRSSEVCSFTGAVVTFDHVGTCVVQADQAGNEQYGAGFASQSITVAKAATTTVPTASTTKLEAVVKVTAPGVGTPTGSVAFTVDGASVGSAPLVGDTATLNYKVARDGKNHTVTAVYAGTADLAGSTASTSVTGPSDPVITATVGSIRPRSASGWYSAPVEVTFTCTPRGSALVGACPTPVLLSTSGADQSVTRSITAADGGTASVTIGDLDLDLVAPTATIGGVKAGKTYRKKQKPTCQGVDVLSGLQSCTVTQVKRGRKFVVNATATDKAGNVNFATVTYKVRKQR
ncbi:MAG TPA: Ig-like domain repeat protein [Nocardioides sp.]|uniref:Ig-like domain repeat protein n=1 Tax=uncultured Nocardioides sp. TaxID=198441 RepID=UPI0026364171|nr:Ig-like domain repeat protein [uncultured Nocardioides sp.]HRI94521.1 Ig-like domain repeat protein [Nocardioides sp.]HRK44437.1 Ig-like domain repeat protein [Nocardioides sp.]